MINTVSQNYKKDNPFDLVSKRPQQSNSYWLQSQNTIQNPDIVEINNKEEKKLSIPKIQILTPEEARKTNNAKLIGLSIAGAVVLTAAGIFFVLKGGPKGISKGFKKLQNHLEYKVQQSKLNNMSDTPLNRFYVYMIGKLDKFQHRSEAINNYTSLKDSAFKKIMYLSKPSRYLHQVTTRLFEKIGRQAVVNAYKKSEKSFNLARDMAAGTSMKAFSRKAGEIVEINGVKKTRIQWLEHLLKMDDDLAKSYEKYFGEEPRSSRYLRIKKSAKELEEHFKDLKTFWSADLVRSFMAEDAIGAEKTAIQKLVRGHRKDISYSLKDFHIDTDKMIIQMTHSISHNDIDKINKLRNIRQSIYQYLKSGTNDGKIRKEILSGADDFRAEIIKAIKDNSMDKEVATNLLENITELRGMVVNFKSGKVEEMLDIYKKLLPESDYKTVEKFYREGVKNLDKSIKIETDDFISKVRDLALGSAPTDVLTILGGLGTLGYYLGKSKDSDERVSISLKYGFPAIAGLGVSLYGNAKLYAGTKAMALGIGSSIIIGKIGNFLDKKLKEYQQSKRGLSPNTETLAKTKKDNKVA